MLCLGRVLPCSNKGQGVSQNILAVTKKQVVSKRGNLEEHPNVQSDTCGGIYSLVHNAQ